MKRPKTILFKYVSKYIFYQYIFCPFFCIFLKIYLKNINIHIKVQGSLLFVTYTIIQGIIGSEMLVRTGPLNGKCKKEKIKHDNKIKIT